MSGNKLNEISVAIGRLEGKVDSINSRLDKMNGAITLQNGRINTCEREIDQMVGKASIVGAIFGFVGSVMLAILGWFIKNK